MTSSKIQIRLAVASDYDKWKLLWDGYNAFYGREGPTALSEEITRTIWPRFFDDAEPVHALVAELDDRLVGLVHWLYHRSIRRIEPVCYLQDLFTLQSERGRGVGRMLIEGVYAHAQQQGVEYVYWQTQVGNTVGRALYDKVAAHAGFIVYAKTLDL